MGFTANFAVRVISQAHNTPTAQTSTIYCRPGLALAVAYAEAPTDPSQPACDKYKLFWDVQMPH
jgi:hypothetical protein